MAFIYNRFQESRVLEESVTLEFFFHGRGTILQYTPIGMFRSLLLDLYRKAPVVRPSILAAFQEKKQLLGEAEVGWQWQQKELEDLFSSSVIQAAHSRKMFIFVDALDEAGKKNAAYLAEYFHDLNDRLEAARSTAKLIISCRHYPVLAANSSLEVCVENENHQDIERYVKAKLTNKRQELAILSVDDCRILEEIVITRALGIFLWAHLIIQLIVDMVRDGEPMTCINEEISKVPPDLGNVYEHILKRVILPRNHTRTLLLMQWVNLAEEPLSVTELRFAIASDDLYIHDSRRFSTDAKDFVDTDSRMKILITSWSGGLVEVRQQKAKVIVQFIHQSVNEFIRSDGLAYLASLSNNRLPQNEEERAVVSTEKILGESHSRLCKSCINYLTLDEIQLSRPTLLQLRPLWNAMMTNKPENNYKFRDKHPFAFYASNFWFLHAEKAESLGVLQQHLFQQFGPSQRPAFDASIMIFDALDDNSRDSNRKVPGRGFTLLHMAAMSNLQSVARIILQNDPQSIFTEDDGGRPALSCAARWGSTEIAQMLLDAGGDIAQNQVGEGTALEIAATHGHRKVVQLLLERDQSVDKDAARNSGRALLNAAEKGHRGIVEILLRGGANVNFDHKFSGSALQAASSGGHEILVRLLLEYGAHIDAEGGYYHTALHAASVGGQEPIVRLLLEKGADVNIQGGRHGTALQAASAQGHEAIAQLLLEHGANVNAGGGEYGSALQAAAQTGKEAIVRLLLDNGADVNVTGGRYGNVLQAASFGGNKAIVELFLEKGLDINAQGGQFGNVLQAASFGGNEEIVELFLEKGLDINAQGGEFGTALQAASCRSFYFTWAFEMLLEKGADVNVQAGKYGSALQAASFNGDYISVKRLLEKGANVNARGGQYGSALQAALAGSHQKIVQLLEDNGAISQP
jgi:ankyrin repeat protein